MGKRAENALPCKARDGNNAVGKSKKGKTSASKGPLNPHWAGEGNGGVDMKRGDDERRGV